MVDLELDDGLAIITINRPEARNAISMATMEQLEKALDAIDASADATATANANANANADANATADAGVRALVITGAGDRAFVSGGDLKELAALRTEPEASAMAWRMRSICDRLANFPAPVLAALNGHALGGGAEFAVAADIRLAADDIKIGFNQVTLAIMPAWGGAERLADLVGKGRALLLAGTGEILGAAEAERIGLIDRVVPRASFEDEWRRVARALAAPPVAEIKRVIAGVPATEAVRAFARLWVSDDHWQAADRAMRRGK
jgi:enoyl-CoA hydratase